MKKKRLKVSGRYSPAHAVASDYLQSSYTYDSEGRMTGQTYPAAHNLLDTTEVAGASFTYEFDGSINDKRPCDSSPCVCEERRGVRE